MGANQVLIVIGAVALVIYGLAKPGIEKASKERSHSGGAKPGIEKASSENSRSGVVK